MFTFSFVSNTVFIDPGQCNRRRIRTQFTDEQLAILERTFTHGSKFPSHGEIMRLVSKTGLPKDKITIWFQNRRAKEKREKRQGGGSKESTTTDSELETEDERQHSICDETPEEDSEIEDTRSYQSQETIDFQVSHPIHISTNPPSDIKPSRPEGQRSSGFYHSEIQDKPQHQNNTTSDITLSHPTYSRTNEPSDIKLPRSEEKINTTTDIKQPHSEDQNNPASGIKPPYLTNIYSITSTDIMHPHPEKMINAHIDIKQPRQEETSAVDSSGPYRGEIQNTRTQPGNTDITIPGQECDSKISCTDMKIQHISTHAPTIGTTSNEPYDGEIEDTQNHQNNPPSDIEVQHPANLCTITPIPPHLEDQTNAPDSVINLPHPEGTNCVDSSDSYHIEFEDTRKHQSNTTGGIKVQHSRAQNNIPSYMVLSLPGGTIAVESTERYHREMKKTQSLQNISPRDVELPHSTNISTNGPTEINVPHPGGTVDVDLSGLYRSKNENTSSASRVQLMNSCRDEKPRTLVMSETTSSGEKPVMATQVSSNDVVNSVKKDNDIVEDSDSNEGGVDEFGFENKKVKTDDMLDTCSDGNATLGNASPEYRMFGEA